MLPRWLLPVAVVTAVISYLGWTAAASGGAYAGKGVVTLAAATLFWLSIMALAAYAVQRGVQRRSGRR
jgi:hypothetical protein